LLTKVFEILEVVRCGGMVFRQLVGELSGIQLHLTDYRERCFGNGLAVTQDTYKKALSRVCDAERAIRESTPDDETDNVATLFRRIERDASTVFRDLKIFQPGGPLYSDLMTVTKAYAFYRSDFGYVRGTHAVAATFLVNLSPFASFVAIANSLNRPLPLAFLTDDQMAVAPVVTSLIIEIQILHTIRTFILHQFTFTAYLFHRNAKTPPISVSRQNVSVIICTTHAVGHSVTRLGYLRVRRRTYPTPCGGGGTVAL
jgi:Rab-GTPase-TBC domain